ncbi:MAG: hypothetical protein QNJ34_02050 [Xenococcaceae cyanobacterium MO_188.B29]|nr:hypothetical protein [Xenococcaceae cyanobacterium MO_188.B29]
MTQKFITNSEIEFASSIDGFQYIKNNQNYSLRDALEKYWHNKSWNHVGLLEAMATLFLILKAIEAWQTSPYSISTEELDKYYEAFHSLYEWIISIED